MQARQATLLGLPGSQGGIAASLLRMLLMATAMYLCRDETIAQLKAARSPVRVRVLRSQRRSLSVSTASPLR